MKGAIFSLVVAGVSTASHHTGAGKQWSKKANLHLEVDRTISEPQCPEGFQFNGELCIQPIFAEYEPICRVGHFEGESCAVYAPQVPTCPEPYMKGIGGCSRSIEGERSPFCPGEFVPGPTHCEKVHSAPVVPVCYSGILENEICVVRSHQTPIIDHYCPDGYVEEAGGCYRTEAYDCTPTAIVPHGKHGKHGHGGYHVPQVYELEEVPCSNLRVDYKGGKKAKNCHKKKPVPVAVDVIARTCQKKVSTPFLISRTCPPGTIDDGFVCILEITSPPVPECTAQGSAQNCFTKVTIPYQYNCPEGMKDNGRACVAMETVPLEYFCPAGTTDTGTQCLALSTPDYVCPRNFVERGGQCVDELVEEPIYTICTTCVGRQCVFRPEVPVKQQFHHVHGKQYSHGH